MRDIFVTAAIFGTLPFILWRPYIGVLVWTWLGFMNIHRLAWGFATQMPFAYIVAMTTLVAFLFSREPKRMPWTRESVTLLIFLLWTVLTTVFAVYPTLAWVYLEQFAKILLMIFVTMMLIRTREQLNLLVWVMAGSLAFYGVKGGIFTIATGGAYHVRGPQQSFIANDNELGLALVMTIPLLRYLQLNASRIWVRNALTAAMGLTALAAIGTQSRGAMLGTISMGTFFWLKSRNKLFTGILIAAASVLVLSVMPKEWSDRMATVQTYERDASAMGRINAWKMAYNMALDRPLGGGFRSFQPGTFQRYAPDPGNYHDAHSIYFEILGEQGFGGLAIFLALGLMTWRTATGIIRRARGDPRKRWAADLAAMVQVSLVGYASAGAFVGVGYFDFYYTLVAVMVLCKTMLDAEEVATQPRAASGIARDARPEREPVAQKSRPA